jgi:iron complex outermembrane receptor protein
MYKPKFLAVVVLLLSAGICFAEDVYLDKIVVTPYRYGEALSKTATSIDVITETEISDSIAQDTVDVLRPVSGVMVRDLYGNGTKSVVDIGGFGEQGALNVLVLIDGRRANDVDLSGVDWSQIPVGQVERIEVLRGGTAAVLYGDNASSGVINIITKKGYGSLKAKLEVEGGSYSANGQSFSLGGEKDKLSYWLYAGRHATEGYRNNSFDKRSDFASKFEYKFNNTISAHFNSGFYNFSYGMPASLNQNVIDQYGRRYARYGDDHTNGKDFYFVFGPKVEIFKSDLITLDFSYRQKDFDSYFLSSGLDSLKNEIETFGLTPKYTCDASIMGRDNKFITGFDFYRYIYTSQALYFSKTVNTNLNNRVNQYSNVNKNSYGWYLQDEYSLLKKLSLVGGYRYEMARYTFGYHDNDLHGWGSSPDQDEKTVYGVNSFNAGVVYSYDDNMSVFANASQSFRFPEVDEFSYTDTNWQKRLDTELKPQTSINYQIGIRNNLNEKVKSSISMFRMDVKNELYFDAKDLLSFGSWIGRNHNYDKKTIHEGVEATLEAKLCNWVSLLGNYTFTNAYFDGGRYSGNKIPQVPQHKASMGLRFALLKNFTFNITGTYVGDRYFMNDQANAYSTLNSYTVADAKLMWRHKDLSASFGVGNLFNKLYSEQAGVTVDTGVKFYYPSPARNFSFKMDYSF